MKIYNPNSYSYITVVEIPKDEISKFDMALCAQPRQTLKAFYDNCEVKPAIIANGGLFNMSNGETIFNYTDNGKIISSSSQYKEGMGTINGELKYGLVGYEPFEDFVSGYPVLIKNGKPFTSTVGAELDYKARRTVLAYDSNNIYIIAVEAPGMAFAQLKSFLQTLKVDYAINLDGGGSTKILHNGSCITKASGNRAVDNVIAVYLKPKTIYRVQAGCFGLKLNANNYLKKIQALGGVYANAYVRKVGGYWKIQIGAFSVKTNALALVSDLKAKGFNAFVTTV